MRNHFRCDYVGDEPGHLGKTDPLFEGRAVWPERVTVLPGDHGMVAGRWQWRPPFSLLTLATAVTAFTAGLTLPEFARVRIAELALSDDGWCCCGCDVISAAHAAFIAAGRFLW